MLRRVLVTGASSGFGLASSLLLSALGFHVTGLVPDSGQADRLDVEARDSGVEVEVVVADLSRPEQRAGVAAGRGLWAVVNNAGYMNAGQIRDVPTDDARRQIETMVLAPADLVRQALPGMLEMGHGRIVNITSSAVHTNTPMTGWYSACKAALRQVNDSLRLELGRCGIDVIDIEPGGYRTGIWDRAVAEMEERRPRSRRPDLYDRVIRHLDTASAIMGDPGNVALAVADVLTVGRPPRHKRVGPGSRFLRLADQVLPDAVWDRAVSVVSGL